MVSRLLDTGTELVQVFADVAGQDSDGNPVQTPAAAPTWGAWVRLHPLSATEAAELGYTVGTTYWFRTRDFPAGAFAKVRARGRDWDVVGEPERAYGSDQTAHVKVTIKARALEAGHGFVP